MRLISLKLKNFQGIKSFEITPNGNDVRIYGDNRKGKTTTANAFSWLLYDKDSKGSSVGKDFVIKTLDSDGNVVPGLEYEASAVIEHNGKRSELRKVYVEKWTKKRGSIGSELTGNETNHFIDGVPVKKNEYVAFINSIADEEAFKLLTDPGYFNDDKRFHWQKRRKLLLEVCGDMTDSEVIAADAKLARLPEILGDRKLEDHRKVIAARRAELNKEIEKIPVRIDEAHRALPDIGGLDTNSLNANIFTQRKSQADFRERLAQVESGGEIAQKKVELQGVNAEILRLTNEHQSALRDRISQKENEWNDLVSTTRTMSREVSDLTTTIASNDRKIDMLSASRDALRAKWNEENAKQLEFNQETSCPTCGQCLPEGKLAEAKEKADADFNRNKAERLAQISAEGKAVAADIDNLKSQNYDYSTRVAELKTQLGTSEQEAVSMKQEIDSIREGHNINEWQPYVDALKKKSALEKEVAGLQADSSEVAAKIKQQITDTENDIASLEYSLSSIKRHKEGQLRIDELKAQEKQLAAEFEKLEGELYLTEQFIRTKVKLLEEKINSRFKLARFKLFNVQVNGGLEECCETIFDGVPYGGGLNSEAQKNVSLDIINTLSEHFNFDAPIIIDNAESVTKFIDTRAQKICLVVSEQDKSLRVEIEPDRKAEVA